MQSFAAMSSKPLTNIYSKNFKPQMRSNTTSVLFPNANLNAQISNIRCNASSPSHMEIIPKLSALESEIESDQGIKKFFEIELSVRDYELDQYGVVNNSVYSNDCQHGHHEFLRSIGICGNGSDGYMGLADVSLKFFGPLRSGDKFLVKVRATSLSESRVYLEHFIHRLPTNEKILEAKATAIWMGRDHQPTHLPLEIKNKILQLYFSENYI